MEEYLKEDVNLGCEGYRFIFESTTEGIAIIQDEMVRVANPALGRLFGRPAANLMGGGWLNYIHPEDRQLVLAHYRELPTGDQAAEKIDFRIVNEKAKDIWIETNSARISWEGRPACLAFLREVDDRKQAEASLKLNEEILRLATKATGLGAYAFDFTTGLGTYSAEFLSIFGLKPADSIELDEDFVPKAIHPQDKMNFLKKMKSANQPGGSGIFDAEYRIILPDGSIKWLQALGQTTFSSGGPEGRPTRSNGIIQDVSESKKAREEIRESEAKFRTLTEQSLAGIYIFQDGKFAYVNPSFARTFGYSPQEIIDNLHPQELIQPEDVQEVRTRLLENLQGKTRGDTTSFKAKKKDGSLIYLDVLGSRIVYHGKPAVMGTLIDTTLSKRAQILLEESEEQYRSLVDSANEAIVVVQDGLLKFVNHTGIKIFNNDKSGQDLIDRPLMDFVHPEDRALMIENYLKRIKGEPVADRNQYRLILIDGIERWVEVASSLIKWNNKTATLNFISDITERKQMERLLRESEERYKLLFEAAPIAINITRGTDIIYANPSYLKLFGHSSLDELKGLAPVELFVPEWRQQILENIQRRNNGFSVPDSYEAECLRKDGSKFPVLMYLARTEFKDGPATIGFILDISKRKKAEEELKEANQQLNDLYWKEKTQSEELRKEAMARGLFIDVLGHELRTPLTPIMVFSGMLNERLLKGNDETLTRLSQSVFRSSQILALRLEELLDLARFARGTFHLQQQQVDLNSYFKEIIQRLLPLLTDNQQILVTEIPCALPRAILDPGRIEQVIINLVSNASKFSPLKSTIVFGVKLADSDLVVEVKDDGIGISAEEQKNLFEPYHRVVQDRQKYPGIGLGLAVSKQIIEAHKGKIWVTSEIGKGSIFSFGIPLTEGTPGESPVTVWDVS